MADPREPKPPGWTRFVCFSDTHGLHDKIPARHRPEADVLLHAGDFTNTGELEQVQSLSEWLNDYPATHKVVIAGNHDVTFHEEFYKRACRRFHGSRPHDCEAVQAALVGCQYLQDSAVEVEGYQIYGAPWQPEFCDWAFNLPRGAPCRSAWEAIPPCPDILITHGPPFGFGDRCEDGFQAGCRDLLEAITQRAVPVSLSGHIHEGYGTASDGVTLFVNASTCTFQYVPSNPPIVFDLPPAAELREATARAAAARGTAPRGARGQEEQSPWL